MDTRYVMRNKKRTRQEDQMKFQIIASVIFIGAVLLAIRHIYQVYGLIG